MSKNASPREQAEAISSGKQENHHIGEHTRESITQELFSLTNTKRMFRGHEWQVRNRQARKIFEEKFSVKEQQEIEADVKKMLQAVK